mmetsp:Transcript_2469/g.9455  ORF Transcript_2469/g.9455 Transcript_2469/m.9455 type:complete len:264 (-) Transcript_2469:527-1318(-)
MCDGPCARSSASSTDAAYGASVAMTGCAPPRRIWPWRTKPAPLVARRSYSQTAATLWVPSRETPSTAYSVPTRNSCTRTPSFFWPSPLTSPTSRATAFLTAPTVWHAVTPSDPADSTGLTMSRHASSGSNEVVSSGFVGAPRCHSSRSHSSTGGHVLARSWRTARTPARRTASPISALLRLASASRAPFVATEGAHATDDASLAMTSEHRSASLTPVSAPAHTHASVVAPLVLLSRWFCASTNALSSRATWCAPSLSGRARST